MFYVYQIMKNKYILSDLLINAAFSYIIFSTLRDNVLANTYSVFTIHKITSS